ncbi:MAG: hypothetical protein JSW39_09495 [Desulfobacterales bacterium]|nr:MAG: hypothetical protein JSW39_09495 [Desulfobacterales bacterium]
MSAFSWLSSNLYQGVAAALQVMPSGEILLDGIQIGLCSVILGYLVRNKIVSKRTALEKVTPGTRLNFKAEILRQTLKQQSERAFENILETVAKERRVLNKLFQAEDAVNAGAIMLSQASSAPSEPLSRRSIDGDSEGDSDDRYAAIERLGRQGLSVPQIAEQLKVPRGEVELLLKLKGCDAASSRWENGDI